MVPLTGKVLDANGNGLAGITVALENGTSVLTDAHGNFTIMATTASHTLTISGPGISTKTVETAASTTGLTIGSISTSKASSDSTFVILAVAMIAVLLAVVLIVMVRRRGKSKQ